MLPSCAALEFEGSTQGWVAFDSEGDDFNRDLYRVRPNGTELERLTDSPAIDREPTFSPDGTQLAFTSDRNGKPQVYLLDLESGSVSQITQRASGADQPSFSHDGSLLAFHSGSSVYTVTTDGSEEHFVASGLDDFNAYFWPHFSADDGELLVDRNNEINAIDLQTGAARYVVANTTTTIKSPAVAPNGTVVAYHVFCGGDGGLSVWTTPFSTSTEFCKGRRITPVGEADAQRPAWGPGHLLAYERVDRASNIAKIALISSQASELHCNLTPGPADNRNPTWWSPAP